MNIDEVFGSEHLKASDLIKNGMPQKVVVEIADAKVRQFDDGNKIELSFVGKTKSMICNKINSLTIAAIHGKDTSSWIGRKITLGAAKTMFQGREVDCIRVFMQQLEPTPLPAPPAVEEDDEIPF